MIQRYYSFYSIQKSITFIPKKDMEKLRNIFEEYMFRQVPYKEPVSLYKAILYVLQNGGKRIRPLLVLMSAKSYGVPVEKALPAASAVEIFHNFTLIHDDIMDHSQVRRGKATVHNKWNENLAILSGDTMLVWAYKMLEKYEADIYKKLNILLTQTAIEICEGQQMDMDFEKREEVGLEEYLTMIRLKTAVLLGVALQYGGIIANADEESISALNEFGEKLGLAFQIQDDYLDTYGDTKTFGKKIGQDIIDRKKTFLYITALERATSDDKKILIDLYQTTGNDNKELVNTITNIYDKYQIKDLTISQINKYTQQALQALFKTNLPKKEIDFWKKFSYDLMKRQK